MKFTIIKMRRDGVALGKSRLRDQTEFQGHLILNETQQNYLHRTVKTARLFRDAECTVVMESLLEANVLWINDDRMMISGFEHSVRYEVGTDFAQSWLCQSGWERAIHEDQESVDHGPKSQRRR